MYISDTAIKRPVLTIVAMLMFVVFGLVALFQLDTDEYPEIDAPVVAVSIIYPGASPDVVEREVVDQIEEAIAGISGVDRMRSSSLDSFASLLVEFDYSKDPRVASQEIRDKISGIRNELPSEMEEPVLTQFDPADRPIVSLTLSSPGLGGAELTRLADPGITRRLRGINGVASVNLAGAVERELVVELRPRDLEASGVGVGQVVQALQSQNLAVPVGRLEGELDERTIRLKGRLDSATEFKDIIVTQTGGRIVRLGDVADVKDGTEEPRSFALFNDDEAVGIDILKSTGFSTTAVAEKVRERVAEIQAALPAGVTLRVVQDSGERVADSVASVQSALIEGAALTVAVVFLFLNSWRSTVITGLALPVSVLASFVAVWAFGFTLNTMSLLGLSLAIGILIDDAIVVRENIVRHVGMGKSHLQAAFEGTDEIGLAVTATTLSIVVVFIPIAFLGAEAGQWFKPFGLTIACSVLVSLFVSFSLDPMLSAYWPDPHLPLERRPLFSRILGRFNLWFDRRAESYEHVIAWALDHRVSMLALAFGVVHRRPGAARDRPGGERAGSRDGHFDVRHRFRDAARIEPRLHPGQGAGGRAHRQEAARGRLHLHERVGPGRRGGRRHAVREADAQGQPVAHAGSGGHRHPAGAADADRHHRVHQRRLQPRREADPAAGARAGCARADAGGRGRGRGVAAGAGGRGRGPVDQGSEARAGRAGGPRPGGLAGRDRRSGGAGAAAGVCRHRRRRLDRSVGRDTRRHGAHLAGIPDGRGGSRIAADPDQRAAGRDQRAAGSGGARQPVDRARAHRPPEPRPRGQRGGQHAGSAALGGDERRHGPDRAECDVPPGLCPEPGRRSRGTGGDLLADVHRARRRRDADVLRAGRAVRVVPRAAGDHAVAAAVAHRRDAGAARHGEAARDHEHDRRDPARGHRGEERHPAHRLREVVGGGRSGPARGADPRRARAAAADPDDHLRARGRHDSGGARGRARAATSARRSGSR